ncbi:hypothetical protein HOE37_02360 [Candidatus Woesearchaeota archaeon]|jgi:hypothetical protein|nr:hypothetical protein [Candidatus Woesearchaeota archaeon]MBT4110676.1 hypothetical protein [Candidatus Woesearchaeota archaeon]MBT4336272.1 hypothetical protein [Candidatus Woesearchaeota archaeon]MBT4469367.1 hypothetical protein [Candidatus Woesearchaeota archaeon]MBT6743810.1 hypothetical protein [Candidatus Woesearchaeota archaeon]
MKRGISIVLIVLFLLVSSIVVADNDYVTTECHHFFTSNLQYPNGYFDVKTGVTQEIKYIPSDIQAKISSNLPEGYTLSCDQTYKGQLFVKSWDFQNLPPFGVFIDKAIIFLGKAINEQDLIIQVELSNGEITEIDLNGNCANSNDKRIACEHGGSLQIFEIEVNDIINSIKLVPTEPNPSLGFIKYGLFFIGEDFKFEGLLEGQTMEQGQGPGYTKETDRCYYDGTCCSRECEEKIDCVGTGHPTYAKCEEGQCMNFFCDQKDTYITNTNCDNDDTCVDEEGPNHKCINNKCFYLPPFESPPGGDYYWAWSNVVSFAATCRDLPEFCVFFNNLDQEGQDYLMNTQDYSIFLDNANTISFKKCSTKTLLGGKQEPVCSEEVQEQCYLPGAKLVEGVCHETDCSDNSDNDGDLKTDCEDPDCGIDCGTKGNCPVSFLEVNEDCKQWLKDEKGNYPCYGQLEDFECLSPVDPNYNKLEMYGDVCKIENQYGAITITNDNTKIEECNIEEIDPKEIDACTLPENEGFISEDEGWKCEGGKKKELICYDQWDNDEDCFSLNDGEGDNDNNDLFTCNCDLEGICDLNIDCKDSDCNNQGCDNTGNPALAKCVNQECKEMVCSENSFDEDQDGDWNCQDSDCLEQSCSIAGAEESATCQEKKFWGAINPIGSCTEVNCEDGIDNDGKECFGGFVGSIGKPCNSDSECLGGGECLALTDCQDPDCGISPTCTESGNCEDDFSNDGYECAGGENDGETCFNDADCPNGYCWYLADCSDPDCAGEVKSNGETCCLPNFPIKVSPDWLGETDYGCEVGAKCHFQKHVCVESNCLNGVDDDNDGLEDCEDPDCNQKACANSFFNGIILPTGKCQYTEGGGECTEDICIDVFDNDGDGLKNCDDNDCSFHYICGGEETSCSDNIDNDEDGFVDCDDEDDCAYNDACKSKENWYQCGDKVDNDGDGLTDCMDLDCAGDPTIITTLELQEETKQKYQDHVSCSANNNLDEELCDENGLCFNGNSDCPFDQGLNINQPCVYGICRCLADKFGFSNCEGQGEWVDYTEEIYVEIEEEGFCCMDEDSKNKGILPGILDPITSFKHGDLSGYRYINNYLANKIYDKTDFCLPSEDKTLREFYCAADGLEIKEEDVECEFDCFKGQCTCEADSDCPIGNYCEKNVPNKSAPVMENSPVCSEDSDCPADYPLCADGLNPSVCYKEVIMGYGNLCYPFFPEDCDNNIDDDKDGKIDCWDEDCIGKEGPDGMFCCIDEDNFNNGNGPENIFELSYYIKGFANGSEYNEDIFAWEKKDNEDFCFSGDRLIEGFCSSEFEVKYKQFICPLGCDDGSCVCDSNAQCPEGFSCNGNATTIKHCYPPEDVCFGEIDEDNDGLTDCEDDDCNLQSCSSQTESVCYNNQCVSAPKAGLAPIEPQEPPQLIYSYKEILEELNKCQVVKEEGICDEICANQNKVCIFTNAGQCDQEGSSKCTCC